MHLRAQYPSEEQAVQSQMGLVESWAAGDVEAVWGLGGGGSHACAGAHAL